MDSIEIVCGAGAAAALLGKDRNRILHELSAPDSAAGVARRLGLPRQKVSYHLRELERVGLVRAVEERRKGNCTERIVEASARAYVIGPQALGPLGRDAGGERDWFSIAHLTRAAANVIRDLGVLSSRAGASGKRTATVTLETDVRFASPSDRNAFAEELAREIARLAAKYDRKTPAARAYRVFAGAYPSTRTSAR